MLFTIPSLYLFKFDCRQLYALTQILSDIWHIWLAAAVRQFAASPAAARSVCTGDVRGILTRAGVQVVGVHICSCWLKGFICAVSCCVFLLKLVIGCTLKYSFVA